MGKTGGSSPKIVINAPRMAGKATEYYNGSISAKLWADYGKNLLNDQLASTMVRDLLKTGKAAALCYLDKDGFLLYNLVDLNPTYKGK